MNWEKGESMPGRLRLSTYALVIGLLLALPATAAAKTEDIIAPSNPAEPSADSGWQAGTCKTEPPEAGAEVCSVDTNDQYFERAAAHPNWGFTQFTIRTDSSGEPVGEPKTIRVDLPVGLSVNPSATPRCPLATFKAAAADCEENTKVGKSEVTVPPLGLPLPATPFLTEVDVYNVEPVFGEAARFGLELAGNEVYLEGDVAWSSDYHEGFTIHVPPALPEALGKILLELLDVK